MNFFLRNRSLAFQITTLYVSLIIALEIVIGTVGFMGAKHDIIDRQQQQVATTLKACRALVHQKITDMERCFVLLNRLSDPGSLQQHLELDYCSVVRKGEFYTSDLIGQAFRGKACGGARIIGEAELSTMSDSVVQRVPITIQPTRKSHPTSEKKLTSALSLEYASPLFDSMGNIDRVVYGGIILNNNQKLIYTIHNTIFENTLYQTKPVGTVTIFLNDVRIATNVLDESGNPALGTRVSDEVFDRVIRSGRIWVDRAFVVTDWYLTAYEPLYSIRGERIGILYVGLLEKPYVDMITSLGLWYCAIFALALAVALILSLILSRIIVKPLSQFIHGTETLAQGQFQHRLAIDTPVPELISLGNSFNAMAQKLAQREESLKISNEKLTELNKTYLDLVSMVSHEFKGSIATMTMNAHSIHGEIVGPLTERQKKVTHAITRNLEFLDATVNNFLNLSRIEKQEIALRCKRCLLSRDIFQPCLIDFSAHLHHRRMAVDVSVPASDIEIVCDDHLLRIVINNLMSNAIKYGNENSRISITASDEGAMVRVSVFNEGASLTQQEAELLFHRFSRLPRHSHHHSKGTGLGLFISKQIVTLHHGTISCQGMETGTAFIFTCAKTGVGNGE
ncbi:MAG: cache domain-containing protein [Chitinivibrionales bacterium]|nr:cache domain-containing protein [Chitinivibrionales bacterium]